MKVPISWLKEYVDFEDTVQGLADKLTFSGTEVEGIHTVGSDYQGIVVGEVLDVRPHPDADRLSLCTVDQGGEPLEVVCGAPRIEIGGKYPFAAVGVTLPTGLKLKKAKIRGVTSMGMLCAEDELGLSDDHEGLLVLPDDARPGTPLAEVLGPPEVVLDLEITPNRPDCLSMLGMAREVAALYGSSLKRPAIVLREEDPPAADEVSVEIQRADWCPRYTARMLHAVTIGPSPDWMRKRLTLAGVRPVNNIVDITNYVMLECGQPLHAFDFNLIAEGRILVRAANKNEVMATLDQKERRLNPGMLVIADASGPVALAGVMGGAGSEIRDTTQTVLLESACFDADTIRRTAHEIGLSSESSKRFERGVDVEGAAWAGDRAAALMTQLAGARCARGRVDRYPGKPASLSATCRAKSASTLLGIPVTTAELAEVFRRLELPLLEQDADSVTVAAPSFRLDIRREEDLIEEYARIHGLNEIPAPTPRALIIPNADDEHARKVAACRATLAALGLREIMNYSLVSTAMLDRLDPDHQPERIELPHPISMDQSVLRTALMPQMIESLGRNRAHQISEAALFELGRVFLLEEGTPREEERVVLGLMGPMARGGLDKRRPIEAGEMFLWMKGILEQLFNALHIADGRVTAIGHPGLEPDYTVSVSVAGAHIGVMGIVEQTIRDEWRVAEPMAVAELALPPLLTSIFDKPVAREVPAYPPIERDVAMIVPRDISHEKIIEVIGKAAPAELEDIRLFDIYEGKHVESGHKSMAYTIIYRSATRTLTDEDANGYHNRIKDALKAKLKAEVREG